MPSSARTSTASSLVERCGRAACSAIRRGEMIGQSIRTHHSSRPAGGRRRRPRADPARRKSRSLRDDPPAQGRHAAADLADRVADSRRDGTRRRRLEDRARHLRPRARRRERARLLAIAQATPAITAKLNQVGTAGRRRARPQRRAAGRHRRRDRAHDRRVRRVLLQRGRSTARRHATCSTRCRARRGGVRRLSARRARRRSSGRRSAARASSGSTT